MGPMTSHLLKVPWLIVDYACNTLAFKLTQILCVPHVTDAHMPFFTSDQ
jgi:hypothetical protein